jgi:hypothetical protein
MNINILTVPNEEIKVRKGFTGADWWWEITNTGEELLQVRVASEIQDWREAMALAIHEAAEALMCKHLGITVPMVDEFDKKFKNEHKYDVNAGDDPEAPYKVPHTYATAIERVLTGALEVDWKTYEEALCVL